jgi:hypothetical protein
MTPFSATARIRARPDVLYRLIADYREGHPRILPRPPFVDLVVEAGGVGAGTVILTRMKVMGSTQSFRATVTEPLPGCELVETTDTGYVTTFRVEPAGPSTEDEISRVTIHTVMAGRSGLAARLEAWMTARMLLPVYRRELALLAEVAGGELVSVG